MNNPWDSTLAAQREAREQSHPVYAVTAAQLEAQVRERQRVWQVVFKRGNQIRQLQVAG